MHETNMIEGTQYIPQQCVSDANMRPQITIEGGIVKHNGKSVRVVLSSDLISVGCTDITPVAAEFILDKWRKEFTIHKQIVMQP